MDRSEIIRTTFSNLLALYEDVSAILQIVESGLSREGWVAKSGGALWERGGLVSRPQDWPARYAARAYVSTNKADLVCGLCVHMGGYESNPAHAQTLSELALPQPFLNVSVLLPDTAPAALDRVAIYNMLW